VDDRVHDRLAAAGPGAEGGVSMDATMPRQPLRLPVGGAGPRALGWWGMVWVIATEAAFFAYLLFSYFYLASMAVGAWPPSGPPELKLAIPNTVILLLSSGAMIVADRAMRGGSRGRLRIALLVTLVLGIVFLVIQGIEFSHKSFGPGRDAYGSLFFTILGFHGAHVLAGLVMVAFATVVAWSRGDRAARVTLRNVAMYWHFVDVVWLAVFASLYLSPRL
jgi:cytochrome c oxidase subunit I+III